MLINAIYLIAGFVLLYGGAESLVRGSVAVAKEFRVSPAIVGLTIIAFGTSVPEISVTAIASLGGASEVALGNIIGSNIANIGLVVGFVALLRPLKVERGLVKKQAPIALIVAIAMYVMMLDGVIGRVDGVLLLTGMVVFGYFAYRQAARERMGAADLPKFHGKKLLGFGLVVVGIVAVLGGGHLFLKSAIFFARHFGVRELFIGLTLVALGTSLPELATALVAAFRRQDDLCLSNVLGSNIVNVLIGIAVAALIRPIAVPAAVMKNEMIFMLALTIMLIPVMRLKYRVGRIGGAVLLVGYFAFIYFAYVG